MTAKDITHQTDISKMQLEADGSFKRLKASFLDVIRPGGTFAPEKDRYHLYVSYACPWATRTLIVRKLKGLEDIIPVTVVSPRMGAMGWPFANVDAFEGAELDPLYGTEHIKDLYLQVAPNYSGRFTVPVLWDKKLKTIVNNESSQIIRMFNSEFNEFLPSDKAALDFYPQDLRGEIDAANEWIYRDINDGVYRAGFARAQAPYVAAVVKLFDALDRVEEILAKHPYVVGDRMTEVDIRLWVTIVRFDPVYVGHFKCNIRTIRNGYPSIHAWLRKLYWTVPAFNQSTNFEHIKTHYYWSHPTINPSKVIPQGPIPNIFPL